MADLSGRIEGASHVYPVRVYYEDTDAGGVVHHTAYLRFAERARTELLRLTGTDQSVLMARRGVAFAVRRCEIDYRAPARLDDLLEVVTRLTGIGGASLRAEQTIRRAGMVLVRLLLRLACIDRDGRPARLPAPVRAALEQFT
ncbi:MAG: tol-pal system-associated acyl-CoA thioesterase [Alphaproteobacteria bacterium]